MFDSFTVTRRSGYVAGWFITGPDRLAAALAFQAEANAAVPGDPAAVVPIGGDWPQDDWAMPGEDHGCTLAERSQADPRALVTLAGGTLTVTDDAGQVLAVTTDPHEAVTALLDALRPARCGVCGEPERHASHRVGGSAGTPRHAWRPASQRGIEGPVNRDGTL